MSPLALLLAFVLGYVVSYLVLKSLLRGSTASLEAQKSFPLPDVQRTLDEVVALSKRQERDTERLIEVLGRVPSKVLESVTSSANVNKGKLGELIAYLGIRASYDRIIPLADIVDFLAVRLPKNGEEGEITFIEVKSGDSARLRKDQVAFKKLVKSKRVSFIELRIEADSHGSNEASGDSPGECSIQQQPDVQGMDPSKEQGPGSSSSSSP